MKEKYKHKKTKQKLKGDNIIPTEDVYLMEAH
jgi:hypothetical protein